MDSAIFWFLVFFDDDASGPQLNSSRPWEVPMSSTFASQDQMICDLFMGAVSPQRTTCILQVSPVCHGA